MPIGIEDKDIKWLEKRVWMPAQQAQCYVTGAGISAGDPVFQEIGSLGFSGIAVASNGDAIQFLQQSPYDLDINHQIRVRVIWSTSSTDADTPAFTVTYSALATGASLVTPVTALDTTITASTAPGVANTLEATAWGIINGGTIADTTLWLSWTVEATTMSASSNEVSILGLEMRYSPRRTQGQKKIHGGWRLLAANPLGRLLHATQESTTA